MMMMMGNVIYSAFREICMYVCKYVKPSQESFVAPIIHYIKFFFFLYYFFFTGLTYYRTWTWTIDRTSKTMKMSLLAIKEDSISIYLRTLPTLLFGRI